jgi:hypothetical protein
MDFAEQQSLLSELLGDPNTSSDDQWPLARRKAALNRGDIQFCKDSHCVREYATGVIASSELTIPSGWLETFCLIIDNEVIDNAKEIDLHEWEKYYAHGSDDPYYYMWEYSGTRKLKFLAGSGVNGKTYELYFFRKQTTALSADADESIIPDEYREAPVYYAANWLLKQAGLTELATQNRGEYDRLVAEATLKTEKEYKKENRPFPDLGGGAGGGGYAQGDGGHFE